METQLIHQNVFTIRGHRIMLDFHLSELYQVETKALNQGVKRNPKRFPNDFMFQLTKKEWQALKAQFSGDNADSGILDMRSQIVTSSDIANPLNDKTIRHMRSQFVTASKRNKSLLPYAFTEQGVAMLSSVLKSERAIEVNVSIIRAFVILRQHLTNYEDLSEKISELEKQTNRKFKDVYEAIDYLANRDSSPEIGFKQSGRNSSKTD